MKLSIIVTVYNAERYLNKCVNSLLQQTIDSYEIILINDGSTDQSGAILDSYAQSYPDLIKVIHKNNEGVAVTRNRGIIEAKGEYITYVDSDDYVEEDIYIQLYNLAEDKGVDVLIYDAYLDFGDSKELFVASEEAKEGYISKEEYVLSIPAPWNKLMKRALFEDNHLRFPVGIKQCEDYALLPSLGLYAERIYYYKKPVVHYYQSENSLVRSGEEYNPKREDIFRASEYLRAQFAGQCKNEVEWLHIEHLLKEGGLYFYKYNNATMLGEVREVMRSEYRDWNKNKYLHRISKKERFICVLLYKGYTPVIKCMQLIKRSLKCLRK